MNEEPFFVRQTDEPRIADERRAWVEARVAEANAEGSTFARFSHHPVLTNVLLFEAWKERPHDQGAPRFTLVPE